MAPLERKDETQKRIYDLYKKSLVRRNENDFSLQQQGRVYFQYTFYIQAFEQILHVIFVDDGRILVRGPKERGCLSVDFVLYQQLALIWQRYLVHYIDNIPLNRYSKTGLRDLHPVNLLQNFLECGTKTIVT